MKQLKKIIRVIIATIIILVVAMNVYNFINIKILNKDLSTIFGYQTLEVVSGSMEPTIHVGELIVIDTNEKNYKEKDIVTFYDINGAFVTHRIESINQNQIITKGDNNDSKDDPINRDKIVGKYIFKIPYLGEILSCIGQPLMLIFILIIGILYSYLISLEEQREKKKTRRQKIKEQKQLQKALRRKQKVKEKLEKKQDKKDYAEFKKMKEEQRKQKEQEEFQEFKKLKEEQRRQEVKKRLEENAPKQKVVGMTNSNKKRKQQKSYNQKKYKNKKRKYQNYNNYKNKRNRNNYKKINNQKR